MAKAPKKTEKKMPPKDKKGKMPFKPYEKKKKK